MMYKYMTLDEIKPFEGLMRDLGVSKVSRGVTPKQGFLQTYKQERGDLERMKTRCIKYSGETWHKKRNKFLARHLGAVMKNHELHFQNGIPTRRTLAFYAWAYDPSPKDTKKYLERLKYDIQKKRS